MRANANRFAPVAVAAVVVAVLVFLLPPYWQSQAADGAMMAIIGLSIGAVYGMTGMISLAQVALSALGGWTVVWLSSVAFGISFPFSLVLAGLFSAPIGLLVALPALRLRGVNLAVVTLGFSVTVYTLSINGAFYGLTVDVPSWLARSQYFMFLEGWVSFVILGAAVVWFRSRPVGLGWLAIRRSERVAASLGVSVVRSKILAFTLSAFIAGVAGGVLAGNVGILDAANFSTLRALTLFCLAVCFGTGYFEGALAIGFFGSFPAAVLRNFEIPPSYASMFFGFGAVQMLSPKLGGHPGGFSGMIRDKVARSQATRRKPMPVEAPGPKSPPAPAADAPIALSIEGLTVKYGAVVALDGVSFSIPAGTTVGLIGPNGAGKSTLVDAVTGFIDEYGGKISVVGQDIDAMPAHVRAKVIRRTFQGGRSVGELTAREFLRLASQRSTSDSEIDELCRFIGCERPDDRLDHIDVRTRHLIQIGACLISRPKVVLLDEPGAGLSGDEGKDLAARIVQIPERFGCSVLLIDHDMELVRAVCHKTVVLDFGKVIAQGLTGQVLDTPQVHAAYLGEEAVA
jgi:branched-chain amino acid transport system permease protein